MTSADRSICAATSVTVRFGGLYALEDVSIEVPGGQISGLVGPNGAGKSTLLGVLSGFLTPQAGEVTLVGHNVTGMSSHNRCRLGLGRTFQHGELFPGLTVKEHLVLSDRMSHERRRLVTDLFTGRGFLRPNGAENERVERILALLQLRAFANRQVGALPIGITRLVDIGRALAARPTVLLMDEPCAGLDSLETHRLADTLEAIVERDGVSVLMVEHDLETVMRISRTVNVLDFGHLIAVGSPSEIRKNALVRQAYLGNHV